MRLLKVLSRHKKEELLEVFEKLGLGDERLKRGRTKKALVSILVDKCVENNLSEVQLLQLELECESHVAVDELSMGQSDCSWVVLPIELLLVDCLYMMCL